ncbi:hypothetical protein [Candidatus Methylobacter oryzae]|uniref:Uncharacterized protein n=1 Tax=Candidatus Methylobacter oryzae TaxID=2497749 RepID=A0ABY3CH08_9GAMM|nr:hypothetical protein [Candidatus Methylobacter oryzae]TRX03257.1 hypothetical protein EKO24_000875 [Candidatus Methylobacter oryzae]
MAPTRRFVKKEVSLSIHYDKFKVFRNAGHACIAEPDTQCQPYRLFKFGPGEFVLRRGKRDLIHPPALIFRSFPDMGRNTHRAQVRPPDDGKCGRFRQPELALCGEQSDRQTFRGFTGAAGSGSSKNPGRSNRLQAANLIYG